MKERFVRTKAIFEIIVLVFAVFSIYSIKEVRAENLGCCFLESEGGCFSNTEESTCSEQGGNFYSDPSCSLTQCQVGCCNIGSEYSYVTSYKCKALAADYGNEYTFTQDISENDCSLMAEQDTEGCCLSDGCSYVTQESCSGEFFENQFCSSVSICGCKSHSYKECSDLDVYWYDSCGNKEEKAEDCDYNSGTKCKQVDGNIKCGSLDCETTYKDENTPGTGGLRKNGESWCVYDGKVGVASDLVGSRHYLHKCIDGEEIVEPCKDFREEICIQGEITNTPSGDFTEAKCMENRYEGCISSNTAELPTSFDDSDQFDYEKEKYQEQLKEDKENCEDTTKHSCTWLGDEESGYCVPLVPPGNSFWKEDKSEDCNKASLEFNTLWTYGLLDNMDCDANCEVFSDDAFKGFASMCRAAGDCGAKYNYVGTYSEKGFIRDWDFDEEELDEGIEAFGIEGLNHMPYKILTQEVNDLLFGSFEEDWKSSGEGISFGTLDYEFIGTFFNTGVATIASYISYVAAATAVNAAWGISIPFIGGGIEGIGAFFTTSAGGLAWTGIAAIGIALIFAIFTITSSSEEHTVETTCSLWSYPDDTESQCELCGLDDNGNYGIYKDCSEYSCKSLGDSCQFIQENEGSNRPACVEVNPLDVTSPVISVWKENITKGLTIDEKSYGYNIKENIDAYKKISLGIKTDKVSKCLYAEDPTKTYNEMVLSFGDGNYGKEHSLSLLAYPNKKYSLYVRCKGIGDKSKPNERSYTIQFNTKTGPDLTSPVIEKSDPVDESYIQYGKDDLDVNLYVNEPAKCRYSDEDIDYGNMTNEVSCSEKDDEFICKVNVELENDEDTYYFKCSDSSGNVNKEAYSLTLIKSEDKLSIDDYAPESGELYTNSFTLNVATAGGAENGNANCEYNNIEFKETDSNLHSQDFEDLAIGTYNYNIVCTDAAGNKAEQSITLVITTDTKYPVIEKLYKDGNTLHVTINEDAECEYSEDEFTFGKGTETDKSGTEHLFTVDSGRYYLICKDTESNTSPMYSINN
ncbi:MAG: hypothetical protein PHE43_02955 [Candidatus Nanoarchaeia archaeon]|nr:hypothetical protein [Candidatus Nanoarchaeia archaeon]